MSDPIVWENIPKSQLDPTTISEAIEDAIEVHNADTEAHLGELASLQAHRTNEILDALAESVVNDKIAQQARRYVAIVDPDSPSDFDTLAGAIDYAIDNGGGDIFIKRGTHYIAEDLYLSPYVSLYGQGQGESVILSNSATPRTIYNGGAYPSRYWSFTHAAYANNATEIVTNDGLPVPSYIMNGMAIQASNSQFTGVRQITDVNDRITMTVSPSLTPASGIDDCDIWSGINLTQDSAIVTLAGDQTCDNQYIKPGMYLNSSDGGLFAPIKRIIDATSFELETPYTGVSMFADGYAQYYGDAGQTIEGLSFGDDTTRITLNFAACKPGSVISSVTMRGGGRLITGPNNSSSKISIQDCIFYCDASDYAITVREDQVSRCIFYAKATGSKGVSNSFGSVFIGCFFYSNGQVGHDWLNLGSTNPKFYGCEFESLSAGGLGTNTAGTSSNNPGFYGCYFSMRTNVALSIAMDNVQIYGGKLTHSAGFPAVVTSGSDFSRIIGLQTTEAITDSSVNTQIVADNISNFVTAGSADTAMILKSRKVVKLTPNSTRTLTTTVPYAGATRQLIILTSGTTSYTLTFGTGFKTTGTLATGTVSARVFVIDFVSDGTNLYEVSRTVAMVA